MKIVKVRIRRGDPAKGEDQLVYPARFNPAEVQRRGIGHINGARGYSGHIGLGGDEEWTFVGLDDDLADEYALDPDMEIVTPAQADAEMEQWRLMRGEPAEFVRDPERIQAIVAKQQAGLALTQEDLDALNPDSPVPGVNRAERAVDIVARANAARADIQARRGAR